MAERPPLPLSALAAPIALDLIATGGLMAGVLLMQRDLRALGGCLIGLAVVGFVASAGWIVVTIRAHQRGP